MTNTSEFYIQKPGESREQAFYAAQMISEEAAMYDGLNVTAFALDQSGNVISIPRKRARDPIGSDLESELSDEAEYLLDLNVA